MTRKILLTGGAGYIGSHTYVALVEAGYHVVVIDDFSNSKRSVIQRLETISGTNVTLYEGSVLDRDLLNTIFTQEKIDAVIHFAARKAVGESTEIPLDYFTTNIGGLLTVLNVMRDHDVHRLVFSSSATVYGEPDIAPTPEEAERRFENPYGYTKVSGEHILEQLTAADACWKFGILRYFNPAGAHPSSLIGEDPEGIPDNLMPYIAKVATGELDRLGVFGDDYDTPDGTGVRDYIHVCDLANAHVLSLNALFQNETGHLANIGTGRGYSVLELLAAYSAAVGRDLPYDILPRRSGDVPIYLAKADHAKSLLGFEAQYSLNDMCQTSWNWIKK
ncbi:MAG: UDP-glucose 4-epimerase GalE [Halocynthiibacter sp.]